MAKTMKMTCDGCGIEATDKYIRGFKKITVGTFTKLPTVTDPHDYTPCSRCRFFMLEVAAKTASRYFFPKIARYRFCIRGLGVYELCLYPIKAFFDCEAPPGDVF